MKGKRIERHSRQSRAVTERQWWAGPAALLATLLALPASANIDVPNDPLTTAARVAPNILFILDDSGSMGYIAMPGDVKDPNDPVNWAGTRSGLNDNPTDRSYLNNSVYYNPNVQYEPWMQANGVRLTGGRSVNNVYSHWSQLSGSRDLRGSAESIFYVPKDGVTSSTNANDFVKYWVQGSGSAAEVVRVADPPVPLDTWEWTYDIASLDWHRQTISVPSGTTHLELRISGNSNTRGNADLYVRYGSSPSTTNYNHRVRGSGSNHQLTIDDPPATLRVGVYNSDSGGGNRAVLGNTLVVTAYSDIEVATPTGRSQEDELRNIATWYSYHRSRIKSAKAGASDAFRPLDSKVRVGFRTINKQNGSSTSDNWPRQAVPIPVQYNDGRFVDEDCSNCDNRTKWYSRLHSASENTGGTPLRTALKDAGEYFSIADATGPYGPQSGNDQYSCRQNFSILTTDGFWNDSSPGVGNADGTDGPRITGPNNQSYQYIANAPENSRFRDSHSNTLADVAMYYWKRDLRGLTNNVPTSASNPAFWQHMVTFGISIGLSGRKGWGSVGQVPANPAWVEPTEGQNTTIDDLLHAAVNGRGAFVAASNPSEFTAGLSEALAAIAQRTSSYSNVATNSVTLDAGTQVFNASYVSGIWTGSVTARAAGRDGISDDVSWTSSVPGPWDVRKVFTTTGSVGANFPTDAQRTALVRTGGVADYPVSGEENANYIRGDQSKEANRSNGTLRIRTGLIGDIVGSSPAYVRDTNTLYVGANDGMLHAFDASNGRELFAYIPNIINFADLATLSRPDYAHKWFVDGPVVVSPRSLTPGRNVLVGTLGKGGKGLYALDVSNPASLVASPFKWERQDTGSGNMGLVLGKPVLGRIATGANAVVVANGINSTTNRAALIVLDLETGAVIREITTPAGPEGVPNGLSTPTGVYGPDGKTLAYVYAGDMLGNVWKFDLTGGSPSAWSARKLFTAMGGDGSQPISGAVSVATHPVTRQRWVFFGTGRYLTVEDADASTDMPVQSMYGFFENEETEVLTRDDLTARNIVVTTNLDGTPVRAFEARSELGEDSRGWYVDLPGDGERIVQDAQVVSGYLVTASMMPMGDACEADGTGYINAIDAFTGTSPGGSFFDLDGDGSTDDSVVPGPGGEGGSLPVGSINVGIGMPTLPNVLRGRLVVCGTNANCEDPPILRPRWDRVSWREIRVD